MTETVLINDLVVSLLPSGSVTLPHGIVIADVPTAPHEVMPDRASPIVVTGLTASQVSFSNPGADPATATFRCIYYHSIPNVRPNQDVPLLWQGGGAASGGAARFSLGTTLVARQGAAAPLTTLALDQYQQVGNFDAIANLDQFYSQCRRDMIVAGVRTPLTATSRAALIVEINSLAPVSGGLFTQSVYVETYDELDRSILPPRKVYGRNGAFARLKAKVASYKGRQTIVQANNWPNLDLVLAEAWNGLFFEDLTPLDADRRALFWMPYNWRRYYDLGSPQGGMTVYNLNPLGVRQSTPLTLPIAPTTSVLDQFDYTGNQAMVIVDVRDGTHQLTTFWGDLEKEAFRRLLNYGSVLNFSEIQDSGFTSRAVFVKPVGMDTFTLPYYDPAVLAPEVVGFNNRSGQLRIRTLPTPDWAPNARFDSSGPFYLADMLRGAMIGAGDQRGSFGPMELRVRWRDIATGRVSPFSTACIRFLSYRPNAPLAAIVQNTGVVE